MAISYSLLDKILMDHGVNPEIDAATKELEYRKKEAIQLAKYKKQVLEEMDNAEDYDYEKKDNVMARNDTRYSISSDYLDIDDAAKTFTIKAKELIPLLDGDFYWPSVSLLTGKAMGDKYPLIEIKSAKSGSHATMTLWAVDSSKWTFKPTTGTIAKRHPQLKGWFLYILK